MLKDFSLENFDIIIQAGQSNSSGSGLGDASEPFVADENIWYLNPDFTISLACEHISGNQIRGNFSLSFAREYIKNGLLAQGRKLLILRSAVGGTGFADKRWGLQDDLYLKMVEMIKTALALGGDNKLIALLWHQGETDSGRGATQETYLNNLSNLLNSVKEEFSCLGLPFIAGDFVQQWKKLNLKNCEPVVAATKELCAGDNAEFVETQGLLSNDEKLGSGDIIHFCRDALYTLGERYFEAYKSIMEQVRLN